MRVRGRWAAVLAASAAVLVGCASMPPTGTQHDDSTPAVPSDAAPSSTPAPTDPAAEPDVPPTGPPGTAMQNRISGIVFVSANSNTWEVTVLEVADADLDDVVMFDSEEPATEPSARQRLVWVCFEAVQTSGFPGSWAADDFTFELWSSSGTHYDHLTSIDYAMADESQDLYFAQGHDLDEPYDEVCALFLVPRDMPLDTVMLVPDDGEAIEVEL